MGHFDTAFDLVIKAEGGYVNDPNDPGGETKYGISKRAYPDLDIASLTLQQAKDIYYADYWCEIEGDVLPCPLNIYVFDSAVNQGTKTAIKLLQRALGLPDDGVIGPKTLAAIKSMKFPRTVETWFMTHRAVHYASLPNFRMYGKGWMHRLFDLIEGVDALDKEGE